MPSQTADAILVIEEQIQAAIAYGLDAMVFTDHGRLVLQPHLDALNQKYAPFRIFGGIEITVQEKEDLLVLGIHDPMLESVKWTYAELHAFVRARHGWIALAHPFRYHRDIVIDIAQYPPDALEGCSTNVALLNQPRIREVTKQLGIPVVCNSDAHATRSLGVGYNLLNEEVGDEAHLVRILRAGAFIGVCAII
ncbi:MAG TPA: PHP-associated domain-containing protein [Anaerolineae bacterium]|nr:PHP-associated domain-containing protein [Anaerolineae bacterium]HQH39403.1 PHP-associated domain-containing protein [Anaerolineae bacterium]